MRPFLLAFAPWFLIACDTKGPETATTPLSDTVDHIIPTMGPSLDRLLGEWHDVQPDGITVFHEQWRRITPDSLAGLGFVMSGPDTVFIEHLGIRRSSNGAVYSARIPSQNNGAFVPFELESWYMDSLLFTNPSHDFPQRIRYAVEGDGWNVEVSGLENDTLRTETFHLTRRPADGASTAAMH